MAGMDIHSVLVTGSSRGIGLELIRQFLEKPSPPRWVFATMRNPDAPQSQELKSLAEKHANLVLLQLELTDPTSIREAVNEVESHLNASGLNLLINNAGIISRKTLETTNPEDMLNMYATNVVGPLQVSQAFLPLLKKAAHQSPQRPMSCSRAAIINISSELGSIEGTPSSFYVQAIPYRTSKAALNMLTKCQAEGYKPDGVLCTALHPGWVRTSLGGSEAPLTVEMSVKGLLKVMSTLSEKERGRFLDWQGNILPW